MDNVFNIYNLFNNSAAILPRGETHLKYSDETKIHLYCLERLICSSINMKFKWLFEKFGWINVAIKLHNKSYQRKYPGTLPCKIEQWSYVKYNANLAFHSNLYKRQNVWITINLECVSPLYTDDYFCGLLRTNLITYWEIIFFMKHDIFKIVVDSILV